MALDPSFFKRPLFPELGGTPPAGSAPIRLGSGKTVDGVPLFTAITELAHASAAFMKNPYQPAPLQRMKQIGMFVLPQIRNAPATLRAEMGPMMTGLALLVRHSQYLVNLRLKTAYHLARSPKILIPISMSIVAGATLVGVQVRNPYLGSTGGVVGQFNSPWAITSFRTSNNENGQIQAVRIPVFLLGGHDFVQAALQGLTYTTGGAPAVQGWPAAAFTETARKNWMSTIQPWNVVAMSGEGVGFGSVMTETGFLQISVFNGTAATYNDTYSVYANATLCGNPYTSEAWTQVSLFKNTFGNLGLQAALAAKLAGSTGLHLGEALGRAADIPGKGLGGFEWGERLTETANLFAGFEENAQSAAIGDEYADPGAMGMQLQGDAFRIG